MTDGTWHLLDNLTANMAGYLADHPVLSYGAIAFTLTAGLFAIVTARSGRCRCARTGACAGSCASAPWRGAAACS